MTVDNSRSSTDAAADERADLDPDAADPVEEGEPDQVERAAQGLITVGLFVGFVTFVLFCLPIYFFN